jgi:acyl-CoA synthetase (AMP-forming)/AMP-acid ligase II
VPGSSRAPDPVAAVLAARDEGRDLALTTSGTTGVPRTVVRTTESWWASFAPYTDLSGVTAGSRVWVPGPLTGTMNLFAAVHASVVGASVVERDRATHACLTPAVLDRHLDLLPRGTRVTVAGDALSAALADRAERAGLSVAHYYGAAELSFVACGRDTASLGAFEGVEIEVRAGVVWVRSPYTAEPGWQTVGDTGTWDGHRLRLGGRPGTVTTAGATVVLADVEAALDGRATCFGVLRESVGEVLAAAVTDADELPVLQALARSRLSPAQRPRVWLVVDELPLTPAGKVDRAALSRRRAPGSATRPAPATPPRSP